MPRIIKDGRIVVDAWTHCADAEPLSAEGKVLVSLHRWLAERDALLRRGAVGVRLANDDDVSAIAVDLPRLDVIALVFPKFTDGRAYSQARLLRERYRYRGELRAVGDVLRDQLFFMRRSGINAFEMRAEQDLEAALQAFAEIEVCYQPAADEPLPLYRRLRQPSRELADAD